jgi:uncharacterized zinc-type alcohol dehydrogenase-like protein
MLVYGGFANKLKVECESIVSIPDTVELESAVSSFCDGVTVFNPLVQYNINTARLRSGKAHYRVVLHT